MTNKLKLEKRQVAISAELTELDKLLTTEDRLATDEERSKMDALLAEAETVAADLVRVEKRIALAAKHSPARRQGIAGGEQREKAEMQAKLHGVPKTLFDDGGENMLERVFAGLESIADTMKNSCGKLSAGDAQDLCNDCSRIGISK